MYSIPLQCVYWMNMKDANYGKYYGVCEGFARVSSKTAGIAEISPQIFLERWAYSIAVFIATGWLIILTNVIKLCMLWFITALTTQNKWLHAAHRMSLNTRGNVYYNSFNWSH